MKLVDYLQALAEDLTEDDLDEDTDLPGSFGNSGKPTVANSATSASRLRPSLGPLPPRNE